MITHSIAGTGDWRYGWVKHDTLVFAIGGSDHQLLEAYVASPQFRASFINSEATESELHGPFLATRLRAEDFQPLQKAELAGNVSTIALSDEPGADEVARSAILSILLQGFVGNARCYVLQHTEEAKELQHECGWGLTVFREFVFTGKDGGTLERYIVGYD